MEYKICFAGLLEIYVKKYKVSKCIQKIVRGQNCVFNYDEAVNSYIWVLWKDDLMDV